MPSRYPSISSESRQGRSRTTIEFVTGRDIDAAANDVRDAVGRIRGELPDEAEEPSVVKSDTSGDPVMRLAVTSSRMTTAEMKRLIEDLGYEARQRDNWYRLV